MGYANDKEEYMMGETVEINGIENISGMQGPYKYKLHVYNATKDQWSTHITNYSEDKILVAAYRNRHICLRYLGYVCKFYALE